MTLVLVWDASPLVHAHKADRLDVLGDIVRGPASSPWSNVTTAAVVEELRTYGGEPPAWLDVVHVDGIGELTALGTWLSRVSSATHSKGEATVLAWAECHEAIAVVDDASARAVGQAYGLPVHGTLWVLAQAVRDGRLAPSAAAGLVDQLLLSGARYPCTLGKFVDWARSNGLLP